MAISGASGAHIGFNVLDALPQEYDKHLVVSEHANVVLNKEMDLKSYKNSDIGALHRFWLLWSRYHDDYSLQYGIP